MQYWNGKDHECEACCGYQRFCADPNLAGKMIGDREAETVETEKHYELEMFPSEESAPCEFRENAQIPDDEVQQGIERCSFIEFNPLEPFAWYRHQTNAKEMGMKAYKKASYRAKQVLKNVFAKKNELKFIGNTYVVDPAWLENEDSIYQNACPSKRSGDKYNCNRPHFHTEQKYVVDGLIPESYWKQREIAIENANKKRERENSPIVKEDLVWVKRLAGKYLRDGNNLDFSRLSAQDGKDMTWGLNEVGRKNYAEKTNTEFDSELLEKTLIKLIRKCKK